MESRRSGSPDREAGILQKERVRLDFPEDRPFRILSLDGGGIKGIYSAAFLARLEARLDPLTPLASYFDLIAGTSTGGIIALGLASGTKAGEILKQYCDQGDVVFRRTGDGFIWPKHSSGALRSLLENVVGQRVLKDALCRLCIPSVDGKRGQVTISKTPHHPDYTLFDPHRTMVDVGMGTAAAPTFFRHHDEGGYQLLDGALIANNPVMVALVDALSCFNIQRRQVHILSIGTGSPRPMLTWAQRFLAGAISWRHAHASFIHYGSKNADGQAGLLIGRDQLHRYEPQGKLASIKMHEVSRARKELPSQANDDADGAWPALQAKIFTTQATPPTFY